MSRVVDRFLPPRAVGLLKGGAPSIVSTGIVSLIPFLGAFFLDSAEYAVWALASTLSTIFIIFDFGTTSLSTKLAAEGRLDRQTLRRLLLITAAPPVLLGAFVLLIWRPYAGAAQLEQGTSGTVYALLVMVAVGTVMRSFGGIYAGAALGGTLYVRRASILVSGAMAQLLATMVALLAGQGILALGIGILAGGAVQLLVGALALRGLSASGRSSVDVKSLIWRFARTKGLATLLGITATQLDRWALGLTTDTQLLTVYDLATRVTTIPKIALLAFAAGLVTEGARISVATEARRVLRKTGRAIIGFYALGSVATTAFALLVLQSEAPAAMFLPVLALVVVAHGFHSATIPGGLLLTGAGRPDFELRYLFPLAILCIVAYALGITLENGLVLVVCWAAAMIGASAFFVLRAPSYCSQVWR